MAISGDTVFYTTYGYFNYLYRMTLGGVIEGYKITNGLARDLCAINSRKAFVLFSGLFPENISMAVCVTDQLNIRYQCDTLRATIDSKVSFADDLTGFLIVNTPSGQVILLKTIDGGLTFVPLSIPPGAIPTVVWFTTPSDGYIGCTDGTVYRTSDQGSTWQISLPASGTKLNAIHFANFSNGMVLGDGGLAMLTQDGGQTWTNQPCNGQLTGVNVFAPSLAYTCNKNSFPVFYKGIYPVGITPPDETSVKVYPVPAKDYVRVRLNGDSGDSFQYQIFDAMGRQIGGGRFSDDGIVYISELTAGLYLLYVIRGKQVFCGKFIK